MKTKKKESLVVNKHPEFSFKKLEKKLFKPTSKPKKKVHRHKWNEDMCDCPFCEGPHKSCECGEVKLIR